MKLAMFLCGYFNARVGADSDCIHDDDTNYAPLSDNYSIDSH